MAGVFSRFSLATGSMIEKLKNSSKNENTNKSTVFGQGRRNEGRAKGGNADGKGNLGLMNYIYKVVDVNPQISKPRNSYNAEIKNLYAVVTISLQIVRLSAKTN